MQNENTGDGARGHYYHNSDKSSVTLLTRRLFLRDFKPGELPAIHAIARHPDFSFYNLDGSCSMTKAFLDKCIRTQYPDPNTGQRENYKLAITFSQHALPVGYVSIDEINPASGDVTDIGYFLHPAWQGYGYASEAARHLCAFILRHHQLPEIWATVHPDNIASQHVLNALNFDCVGPKATQFETTAGYEPRLVFRLKAENLNKTPVSSKPSAIS